MMIWEFFFKAKFIKHPGSSSWVFRIWYYKFKKNKTEYISIDEGAKKNCFVVVDNFLGYSNI